MSLLGSMRRWLLHLPCHDRSVDGLHLTQGRCPCGHLTAAHTWMHTSASPAATCNGLALPDNQVAELGPAVGAAQPCRLAQAGGPGLRVADGEQPPLHLRVRILLGRGATRGCVLSDSAWHVHHGCAARQAAPPQLKGRQRVPASPRCGA